MDNIWTLLGLRAVDCFRKPEMDAPPWNSILLTCHPQRLHTGEQQMWKDGVLTGT